MATTRKNLEAQVLRMLNLPPDVTIDSSEAKLDSDLITLKLPDPQDHMVLLFFPVIASKSW